MSPGRKSGLSGGRSTRFHRRKDSTEDEKTAKFIRELVASTPSQRNYKGILISLLVICAVCGLILLAIYLLRPPDDGPRVKGRKITLDDLSSKRFSHKPFNGSWISGNEILFQDDLDRLTIFDADTFTFNPLVANTTILRLKARKFSVSPDRKFILLTHDVRPKWEHSSLAKYTVYDIDQELHTPVTPFKLEKTHWTAAESAEVELQYAEWGPRGHSLILVYKNEIYYKPTFESTENAFRITRSGQEGVIFNGLPNWLYEVEILKTPKAFWVSPNGKLLLFATFNDSMVGEASFPWYGENQPYPQLKTLRYPKAGTTNPEVKLWMVKLDFLDDIEIRPNPVQIPATIDSRDHYISNVEWIDNTNVSIVWMNRHQKSAVFGTCSSRDWICNEIYILKPPGIGWLEFPDSPIFSLNKSSCLLRIPWRDGEAGYFHHVIWLDLKTGKDIPLTSGSFHVSKISAWDQSNQIIYFTGVPTGKPGERHLYRVSEKSSNSSVLVPPVCMTCPVDPPRPKKSIPVADQIFPADGASVPIPVEKQKDPIKDCLYNQITFSPSNDFFIRECLGPDVPYVTLHRASSGGTRTKHIFRLDDNSALRTEVTGLALPQLNISQILTSSGQMAQVKLYLPPGFRENEGFRFPTVLHLNGPPGTQLVSEKWEISWASYLSSQKNFIVVEIDTRGFGFQGEGQTQNNGPQSLTDETNSALAEVADLFEVLEYLIENRTYIDEKNMAVWGWGYGGYMTLLTLAEDVNKSFRCGISIAPITKWEFLDSVFAEKYLGMPNYTENYHGYEEGDLVRIVKKLQDQNFMIIHGSADERVHYQHTLHLAKELIRDGVSFTEQIYPDEGHDLSGVTEHLYSTMEDFLDSCFEKPDWDDWERANFLGIPI